MKRIFSTAMLMMLLALGAHAQTAPDAVELTKLLNEFLAGASRNDPSVHDRFWADDVIYTGSAGKRRGKSEIMKDVRSAPAPKPGDPTTVFSAADIRIQQYGNTAGAANFGKYWYAAGQGLHFGIDFPHEDRRPPFVESPGQFPEALLIPG